MFDYRTNRTAIERLGSIGFDWFLVRFRSISYAGSIYRRYSARFRWIIVVEHFIIQFTVLRKKAVLYRFCIVSTVFCIYTIKLFTQSWTQESSTFAKSIEINQSDTVSHQSRLLSNGRLRRLSCECGRVKFCSRSPSGHLNISFPSYLSDDQNLLMKSVKKIVHTLNETKNLFYFYHDKYGPKHGNKSLPPLT